MNITATTSLILLVIILAAELFFVDAGIETMTRPSKPRVFTSVDQFRRYLDQIRYYYSINGRARYGKRSVVYEDNPDNSDYNQHGNSFLKSIDDNEDNLVDKQEILEEPWAPIINKWLNKSKWQKIHYEGQLQELQ